MKKKWISPKSFVGEGFNLLLGELTLGKFEFKMAPSTQRVQVNEDPWVCPENMSVDEYVSAPSQIWNVISK